MQLNTFLVGLGYALLAVLLALLVIVPIFLVINWIYDDGKRLTPLVLAVIVAWLGVALLLARRRISLG